MNEIVKLNGKFIIIGWKKNAIPFFLKKHSLEISRDLAELEGAKVFEQIAHNLIVTSGKGLIGDAFRGYQVGATYHAIGTGSASPAAGDTTLGTEVARKLITGHSRAVNIITLSTFFLAAESTYNIQEVGVFGGDSASLTPDSGVLFSRVLQSVNNSSGLYDLTFDYQLTVT